MSTTQCIIRPQCPACEGHRTYHDFRDIHGYPDPMGRMVVDCLDCHECFWYDVDEMPLDMAKLARLYRVIWCDPDVMAERHCGCSSCYADSGGLERWMP